MGTFTTYNSWGRTRSPKNLAGENGTEITVLANTNDLVGITASTAGYATENQRYLHVLVEDAERLLCTLPQVFWQSAHQFAHAICSPLP